MRLAECLLLMSLGTPLAAAEVYVVGGTMVHSLTRAPLAKTRVSLAKSQDRGQPVTTVTGPDGRFQFTQVPAGKYSLSAERNGFVVQEFNQRRLYQRYSSAVVTGPEENTADLVFALVPGAVISGRVNDVNGDPVAWAQGTLYRVTGTGEYRSAMRMGSATADDQGVFRFVSLAAGRYVLAMQGKPWYADVRGLGSGEATAYPLTFYPATTNPASAELIDLAAGQEFQVRVVMAPVPTYDVVIKRASSGKTEPAILAIGGPSVYGATSFSGRNEQLRGGVHTVHLAAGRYRLILVQGQALAAVREVEVSQNDQQIEFGEARVAEVRGTVEVRGDRAKMGAQLAVMLRRASSDTGDTRAVEPDGTFRIPGVEPGPHRVLLSGEDTHVIRSITAKGAQLHDGLLIIPATGTVELKLVVDAEAAEIDGRLTSDGRGVSGALVVVTAKGRLNDEWLHRMDQTDSDGSFSWRGLAPGEYLAFVFPDADEILAADPAYLQGFLSSAIPVTIQGGGKQHLDLVMPKP